MNEFLLPHFSNIYQMIEGVQPFHTKTPEEAARMICLEDLRPPFKNKPKHYLTDLKEYEQIVLLQSITLPFFPVADTHIMNGVL